MGLADVGSGTLAIQHAAHVNGDSVADGTRGIAMTLEKNL